MLYAKSMKQIIKQKIEKGSEQKNRKGQRGTVSAQQRKKPAAHPANSPNRYPLSLFLPLTAGPTGQGQVVFNLRPSISPETAAINAS
jgi:hypothetical protein